MFDDGYACGVVISSAFLPKGNLCRTLGFKTKKYSFFNVNIAKTGFSLRCGLAGIIFLVKHYEDGTYKYLIFLN